MLSELQSKGVQLFRFEPADLNRIESLANNKLWISNPEKFNDPFDFDLKIEDRLYRSTFDECDFKKAALVLFENYDVTTGHWLYSEEIAQDILNWARGETFSGPEFILSKIKKHIGTFGVQCFSQDWDILLSWAHYAESHKGFCIEYELSEWEFAYQNNGMFAVHDVVYSNRLSEVCLSEIIFSPHQALPKLLASKTTEWAYEKEKRIVSFGSQGTLIEMPKGLKIKSLIAGLKMEKSSKSKLLEAASSLGATAYEIIESKYDRSFSRVLI